MPNLFLKYKNKIKVSKVNIVKLRTLFNKLIKLININN